MSRHGARNLWVLPRRLRVLRLRHSLAPRPPESPGGVRDRHADGGHWRPPVEVFWAAPRRVSAPRAPVRAPEDLLRSKLATRRKVADGASRTTSGREEEGAAGTAGRSGRPSE